MDILQIPIEAHPLLAMLHAHLLTVPRPHARVRAAQLAAFREDLAAGPGDGPGNRETTAVSAHVVLTSPRPASLPDDVEFRSLFYYPPGGGMGWHTNSNAPGWRIYVVRAEGLSWMHTPDGRMADRSVHANVFKIEEGGCWHAVEAESARWSLGVRVSELLARAVLQAA